MRFEGTVKRDGRFWLAEVAILDALTQGRTRKEALEMMADWLETMVAHDDFRAQVHPRGKTEFEVSGTDAAAMTALLLRRRRQSSGASLRDMATRMGSTSRNAYARYERGEAVPTVDKLDQLLKAVTPGPRFRHSTSFLIAGLRQPLPCVLWSSETYASSIRELW